MHLGNLPDDGYRELEAVCVGLRFGKVDHYVVLKNKNKVSIIFPMVQSTLLGKKNLKKIFFFFISQYQECSANERPKFLTLSHSP